MLFLHEHPVSHSYGWKHSHMKADQYSHTVGSNEQAGLKVRVEQQ